MKQPDTDPLEEICELLESGDAAGALEALTPLRAAMTEPDPMLEFLIGVSQLDLKNTRAAIDSLKRAQQADPDDPEFRTNLALALFRNLEFDAARQTLDPVLEAESVDADAWYLQGLLLEREGGWVPADLAFGKAAEADPDRYYPPQRLPEQAFLKCLEDAMDRLPEPFARHLEQVAVTVEPLPSDELLGGDDPPFEPEDLLGLFTGPTLADIGAFDSLPEVPPRILLFQRNLERACENQTELLEEIAITLYHELGHYLGLDEEELEAIDLG